MNVLVIAEDFQKDQFILKRCCLTCSRRSADPRANVDVCRDPLLRGVNEALKFRRITEIVHRHGGMTDIFVLGVDRDGVGATFARMFT